MSELDVPATLLRLAGLNPPDDEVAEISGFYAPLREQVSRLFAVDVRAYDPASVAADEFARAPLDDRRAPVDDPWVPSDDHEVGSQPHPAGPSLVPAPRTARAVRAGSSDSHMTAVQQLAAFAGRLATEIPDAVMSDAANRVLDVLGNCFATAALPDHGHPHNALLRVARQRGGVAEAEVIGADDRLPASSAALVNGTLAHALDFDDTHLPSVLHPSSSIVPAALAMAQARGSSGAELLRAVAAGDEICVRLGMAGYSAGQRNSVFFDRGLHATSICGTIGAAAAAGLLLGLDARGLASAMGIAASMGAGIIEANRTGGTVKRMHCGWAAHAGIEAASFAAEGVTGPPTVLEGRFGFLQAYLGDEYDLDALVDSLGERWELLRTAYKPYPSNHFTHPGIDCALALRAQGLRPADIARAELGVAAAPLQTIGEPRENKIHPESEYHAKFSGPYTVATALVGGGGLGVGLDDFTGSAVRDPERLRVAQLVDVVGDARCDDLFPNSFGAVLRVETLDGRRLEHRVDSSLGAAERPLTPDQFATKFAMNAAAGGLSPAQAAALVQAVGELAARANVTGLFRPGS